MSTVLEVEKILTGAMALYPGFKLQVEPGDFAAAWHRHVGHLPAETLQAAMDRAVRGSEFFPSVHEVLKAAGQIAAGAPKTGMEAWAELEEALSKYGYYCPPDGGTPDGTDNWQVRKVWHFSDPLIARLIPALGGWCALSESKNIVSDRAQFIKAYELMAAAARYHAADPVPQIAAPAVQVEQELGMDEVQARLYDQVRARQKMARLASGIGKP